jgi:hypothetical protein
MRPVSLLFHDVYESEPRESGFRSPAADRYKLSVTQFEAQLDGLLELRIPSPESRVPTSGHDLRNDPSGDVRESHVAAVEPIRQPRVLDAEQVQNRRVQIVEVDRLLGRLVAELIARSDDLPALDSRARHPHRHRPRVVVAAHAIL